ncbi:hypothetical protein B0H11DRAFT_1910450 [Mycena galericulata]|nr:hypothetical protein B0H11DRAFT_1910450 [Mycena galericulata]
MFFCPTVHPDQRASIPPGFIPVFNLFVHWWSSWAPAFNREGGEQGGEEWNGVSCEGCHTHSRFQPRLPLSTARVDSRVERSGTELPARGQPSRSVSLSTQAPAFNREGGQQGGEEWNGVACEGSAGNKHEPNARTDSRHTQSRFQPRLPLSTARVDTGWRGVERNFLRGVSRSLSLSTQAPAFNREGGEQGGEGVDGQLGPGPFLYVENRGRDLRP